MKGILKKVQSVLKRGLLLLPAACFVISATASVITAIDLGNKEDAARKNILNDKEIVVLKEEKIKKLDEQLENAEITKIDYLHEKKYLDSEEFLNSLLELPEFAEQKAILKNAQNKTALNISFGVIFGSCVLSISGISLMLFNDEFGFMVEDFWDSASDDWNWKPPKKESLEIEI